MDPVTAAVRDQYDRFPYPDGQPVLRVGWDARYLLAKVAKARPKGRKIQALDAGCGRGLGITGAASVQPDVQFTGVDISSTALEHARAHTEQLKLKNVTLDTCDLMTLEGLAVPEGGFDVIYSSGVLHHLSDPEAGLRGLAGALAPHGVIQLMVYGTLGRQALTRFAEAVKVLLPEGMPLAERLIPARQLAATAEEHLFPGTRWEKSIGTQDAEFVDRFLNVNETAYDVPGLHALAEQAGLCFIAWSEPADWDPLTLVGQPELQARLRELPEADRHHLVELLAPRPALECILAHADNAPRPALSMTDLDQTSFVVNPDVTFAREVRNLRKSQRVESLRVTIRAREPITLKPGPEARAGLMLAGQAQSFKGKEFIQALAKEGVGRELARQVLVSFLVADVVYVPHAVDV